MIVRNKRENKKAENTKTISSFVTRSKSASQYVVPLTLRAPKRWQLLMSLEQPLAELPLRKYLSLMCFNLLKSVTDFCGNALCWSEPASPSTLRISTILIVVRTGRPSQERELSSQKYAIYNYWIDQRSSKSRTFFQLSLKRLI